MDRRSLLFVLTLLLASAGAAQTPHDGDWWRALQPGAKQCVLTGFLDGMALGQNLSLMGAGNSADPDCRSKIAQSYSYVRGKFFRSAGEGDIASALEELYAEPDNRSIIIGRAVWIAVNLLAGVPKEEVEKLVLQSRGVGY
jgi:hypothetical protein